MTPYSEQEKFKNKFPPPDLDTDLEYFFSNSYHDMRFFLNTITRRSSSIFTYFGDMQKNLFYISDNMRDTFGFEKNIVVDLLGQWHSRIHGEKWRKLYDQNLRAMLSEKQDTHDLYYQVTDAKGKVFWVHGYGAAQWDEKKEKILFLAGRISCQNELFTVDSISNFPIENALTKRLEEFEELGEKKITIGCSLNNISQINVTHGRATGDFLIKTISQKLIDTFIGKLNFYRLSGIRCMAVVENGVDEPVKDLIAQIRGIIEAEYEELGFKEKKSCSFAVMEFPQPYVSPEDFQENMISLIKLAVKDPQQEYIEYSKENIEKIQEFSNLQMALSRNVMDNMENFRPVIQLVVDSMTGKIVAGETLMRWKYKGNDVSPGVFIPELEKNDMIHIAGRWILEQAVQVCAEIIKYIPDFYLTVNVSLEQLDDDQLLPFIPHVLEKHHVDGKHLVLEMTESVMDQEPARLRRLIAACQELGIRIALDDFGTGYSSIRVLLQYDTSIIKLDRSLLLEMTHSKDSYNFISTIVLACHQVGKKVCMEGVEDAQQNRLVQNAHCDLIQGFYYHCPRDIEEVYGIVKKQALGLC